MPTLTIQTATGEKSLPYPVALAKLRIKVFQEWPYLYEGHLDYEKGYLAYYAQSTQSIVVLAKDGEQIVGASTAMPMTAANADFQKPFEGSPYPLDSIFYLGESVLLPAYRGHGVGHQFFDAREAQAAECGYRYTAFCALDRTTEDPRCPKAYHSLEPFWEKRGYQKHPEIQTTLDWREVGDSTDSSHTLTFWIKELNT